MPQSPSAKWGVDGDGSEGVQATLAEPLLTVTYTGEPDEVFELREEGDRLQFGRAEDACEIVIWSAINDKDLSRVAGVLWRMEDEVWIRNLSTRHDLYLESAGRPPESPLPPRRDAADRGAARAVPGELTFVRGPGGCELLVRQFRPSAANEASGVVDDDATQRMPAVPESLRAVAAALCAPLLRGSQLPASYGEILRAARCGSLKRTRVSVAELCALYAEYAPGLAARVSERIEREAAQLGLSAPMRKRGSIWASDAPQVDEEETSEVARRRALSLPDYYEVAHLLVRRHLVGEADLAQLDQEDPTRG